MARRATDAHSSETSVPPAASPGLDSLDALDAPALAPDDAGTAPASIAEAPAGEWNAPRAVSYAEPEAVPQPVGRWDDPELPYWLAFNRARGIGPARFRLLLEAFGTAEAAWGARIADWQAAGLDARTASALERQRRTIVPEAEVERLLQLHVGVLCLRDPEYPRLLREIPLPPPVLYVRGAFAAEDEWAVAIVGTRRASAYGKQITERLARELAEQGITIVSGLARGIDTVAHTAALDAGGRTIALLGCGPDLVYPPENAKLAARMIERGAIVTEFAPGRQPEPGNFPARNRLISGLAMGVLVTEAPMDSGALITTRFAAEQGRDVFAVPGNITSRSSVGANRLIQDGARLVLDVRDVLEGLNLHLAPQQMEMRELLPENETEARLLAALTATGEPLHIDELCRATGVAIAEVSGTMVMLELKGLVRLMGPMTYARA